MLGAPNRQFGDYSLTELLNKLFNRERCLLTATGRAIAPKNSRNLARDSVPRVISTWISPQAHRFITARTGQLQRARNVRSEEIRHGLTTHAIFE
jgi:hypothetical protein